MTMRGSAWRKLRRLVAWGCGWALAPAVLAGQANAQSVAVSVQNLQSQTLYVAFTIGATQGPGPINWGNCAAFVKNNQAVIPSGFKCNASVATTASSSRFCASTSPMTTPNCYQAQTNHQTMVETTFGSGSTGTCTSSSMVSCVWYDISVIPATCTDQLWKSSMCANTRGAAYNLPVALSCQGQPTYTCQGPPTSAWGNSNYPSKCGNPNATCVGNTPNCVNTYFYPMFYPPENKYQPVAQCPAGSVLQINFLAGP